MKMPEKAPALEAMIHKVTPEMMLLALTQASEASAAEPYWHWDDLKYRPAPEGVPTREAWWLVIQCQRLLATRKLNGLLDQTGVEWRVVLPPSLQAQLSKLDRQMSIRVLGEQADALSPRIRDQFIIEYLTQEAWASSFIEGAVATREQARDMVSNGRAPRDTGERMVLNNYRALERVRSWRDRTLTPEMVLEIQRMLVEGTDVKPGDIGQLRLRQVVVSTAENEVLHEPPAFEELPRRLAALCEFANREDELHPIVRAVALHFMLAYDHPFGDGNGRTARALFYWAMLRAGYWLVEFMPISDVIRRAPKQYGRAFLLAETDNQDFTHFLAYHMEVLLKANAQFIAHVDAKRTSEQTILQLAGQPGLGDRQRSAFKRMLSGELPDLSFESHMKDHRVTYVTARKDIEGLLHQGFITERGKEGRRRMFVPAEEWVRKAKAAMKAQA